MSFFAELKRRNVFRVGIAYIVAAWVVLQVADLVFEAIKAPDWVLQALLALLVLGFFASVIIAWAYELTPEGVKRESEVDRSQSVTHETAHKLNRITIGLLVVVVALVAVERFVLPQRAEPAAEAPAQPAVPETTPDEQPSADDVESLSAGPSVAVLPFVNMSSDPEQEFFSDGISEEILNVLTRIPNLKVAARTSSFQFKGQNLDIPDIARQLKVNHVLEGSVRKSGPRLRITAQLIEAESGYHLWSDTFDRQLEDVFAIQDEIANAIAAELRARLAGESLEASQVVNMEAYERYLKGRGLVSTRREADLYEGIQLLETALSIEPEYAPAMATMAKAYVVLPWFTRKHPAGWLREQARLWAERALEYEPDNAEALAVLGVVHNEVDLDPERALEVLRRAVAANPGSLAANNFLGDVSTRTWDLETAMIYESRAAELDPLGAVHVNEIGQVYLMRGDFEKAVEMADRALAADETFPNAHWVKIDALYALGESEELETAAQHAIRAMDLQGADRDNVDITVHMARGEFAAAREILAAAADGTRAGEFRSVDTAYSAVLVGDFDVAGEMLLQAHREQDGTWTYPWYVRLPEQAPDSKPWQEFWRLPGPARLAAIRRGNGLDPRVPGFGEGRPE